MKMFASTKLLMIVLLLSACSVVKNPVPLDVAGAQTPLDPPREYQIQVGDQLEIKFFYNPELNEQVTVRPDGRISLQLASEFPVSGMTPSQLTDFLEKKYAAELENPEVTVFVRSFSAQKVYVDGEVNRAGLVTLTHPMTVLQSVSQAGGFRDTARVSEVIVVRKTADNKLAPMVVDLEKAIDGSDLTQDIILMPNDIVHVPRSRVANVNSWIERYFRRNVPLPIGFGMSFF